MVDQLVVVIEGKMIRSYISLADVNAVPFKIAWWCMIHLNSVSYVKLSIAALYILKPSWEHLILMNSNIIFWEINNIKNKRTDQSFAGDELILWVWYDTVWTWLGGYGR